MTIIDYHQGFQFAAGTMLWALAAVTIWRSRLIAQGVIERSSPTVTLLFGAYLAVWAIRQTYWNVRYLVAEISPEAGAQMASSPVFAIGCSIASLLVGAAILTLAATPFLGRRAPVAVAVGVLAVVAVGFALALPGAR